MNSIGAKIPIHKQQEIIRKRIGPEGISQIKNECGKCFDGDCSGLINNTSISIDKCVKTYNRLGLKRKQTLAAQPTTPPPPKEQESVGHAVSGVSGPGIGIGGSGGVFILSSSSLLSSICLVFIILK